MQANTTANTFRSPAPLDPPPPNEFQRTAAWVGALREEISRVLVGQTELVDGLLVALLSNGHVLLEGVPGLAKTLALKTLASAVDAEFSRIQFTPDMLPADVVGTLIYNPREANFETKHGPVFANFVLADEINRAPAKVQSSLLEAMQERQVTLGDTTHHLPEPFLVMATQNPVEQEGTYPLPEAQLDRFMLKLVVDYPSMEEEHQILDSMATTAPDLRVRPVVSLQQIEASRHVVDQIYIDDRVKRYILSLVDATRNPEKYGMELSPLIRYGASPRATIALALASKAKAYLGGRGYVTPQDVKALAPSILRHRVAVTYEAEAQRIGTDQVITTILGQVAIP